VKIQEDFKALGSDTLSMLEEYIEHCDAVVHFAGEMTGSTPKDFGVAQLLARRPDLKTRLPPLGTALARISQTMGCIEAANQRNLLCIQHVSSIRGAPRCKQSVSRICLDL
jgi:hypothetical protein